jgi:16S rRNA (adenine1518-N6/adenine1519-N6)-dimethyltransferase
VVRQLLENANVHPSRGKGQNFLVDSNVLRIIEKAACLSDDDIVIEVGAGLGALTQLLVRRCRRVYALESDRRLFDVLARRLENAANLSLIDADAMRFDPASIWGGGPPEPAKTVSNLPYQIAATLIIHWLINCPWIEEYTVMVQREVADRITAARGGDYSAATVKIAYRASVRRVAKVSRNSFYPKPRVDSAIVRLVRREAGAPGGAPLARADDERLFDLLVTAAFQQRRKKLTNSLSSCAGIDASPARIARALHGVGKSESSRAEELSPEDFVSLSNELGAAR